MIALVAVIVVGAVLEGDDERASPETFAAAQHDPSVGAQPPARDPEALASGEAEVLTVENNEALAELMVVPDPCAPPVADFVSTLAGQEIQFDGNISAMANHGDYSTRYDILLGVGDYSETSASGPAFQFRDVNLVHDLRLAGENVPETLGIGDPLRVTAIVDEYEERSCLLLLTPVSTEVR